MVLFFFSGRKAQLAYVNSSVKPPREILRKQRQLGTACISKSKGHPSIPGSYKPSLSVPAYNPMANKPRSSASKTI